MNRLRHPSFCSLFLATLATLLAYASDPTHNQLSEAEEKEGWTLLFDGKSMERWRDPSKLTPPGDAWTIEDGCLKANAKPRITEDLVSQQSYRDFELQWEWRISAGGNSGVKYKIQAFPVLTDGTKRPNPAKFEDGVDYAVENNSFDRSLIHDGKSAQIYVIGFEYQMIDNAMHADAQRGPLYQSGAMYGVVPPLRDATVKVGDFNRSRLIVRGEHVEHWLNGERVVDTPVTAALLTHAMGKRWGAASPTFRMLRDQPKKECPISLQNHGDAAWFRDLKIRVLQQ